MKEECVWLQDWESAEELATALDAWRRRYSETRPHQALDWQTPTEYRAAHLAAPAQAA
jgi:transposase InsO family protein